MSILSQAKAAKLAGVSRGTIANRIIEGKLSKSPDGVDVDELCRVFPEITTERVELFLAGQPVSMDVNDSETSGHSTDTLLATFEASVDALKDDKEWLRELVDKREQQLSEKDALIAEKDRQLAEKDRQLTQQFDRFTALLPAPEAPKRRRFLGIF